MTTFLADGNVLVALTVTDHIHHTRAVAWYEDAAPDWHEFWADDLPYQASHLRGVIGHRQVTDAYLVALAAHHGGRVVTLDKGLAALHGDGVLLLA